MVNAITEVSQGKKIKIQHASAITVCTESREEGYLNVFEMLGQWSMIYTFLNLNVCEWDK